MFKAAILLICLTLIANALAAGSCGTHGQLVGTDCICAAYTQYYAGDCVAGTGVCAQSTSNDTVESWYPTTFNSKIISIGFEGTELVIHTEWTPYQTAVTNVRITPKDSDNDLDSLYLALSGGTRQLPGTTWNQYLGAYDGTCGQVVESRIVWTEIAPLTEDAVLKGLFEFNIHTSSVIKREKAVIKIRNEFAEETINDVIPVLINFNATVNTTAIISTNFSLSFDINVTYALKSLSLNPSTMNLTIVVVHNVSHPLNLQSINVNITVIEAGQAGVQVAAYSFEDYSVLCPDWRNDCEATTTIIAQMPTGPNCTEYDVDIRFDLNATCVPGHYNESSTLCYGVTTTLPTSIVPVYIPAHYRFCPHFETTEVSVIDFVLTQDGTVVNELDVVNDHFPINGTIHLNVDRKVRGSVLYWAKIASLKLYEKYPGVNSVPYFEITDPEELILDYGTIDVNQSVITITFSYNLNYENITTFLQEWYRGIYFEAYIEVAFTAPGVAKKRADQAAKHRTFRTVARLASQRTSVADIVSVDKAESKSVSFTFDKAVEEANINARKQQAAASEELSQKLNLVKEKNDKMLIAATASVGGAVLVALVAIIVVVSVMLKKNQNKN